MKKSIFIHSALIEDVMNNSSNIGGITIQLYFWAKIFSAKGWTVYSMSSHNSCFKEGIHFIKYTSWGKLDILHGWLHTFWMYLRYRPGLVMERGAGRALFPIARLAKLFGVKSVFFGASDINFEPEKQNIAGGSHNLKFYRKGLEFVDYFVTQNAFQHETLLQNYKRESLVLPNIWGNLSFGKEANVVTDIVWVANMRPLKRPEWVFNAARMLPNVRFTMIGGVYAQSKDYYNHLETEASGISNLEFLGPMPFVETSKLIRKSKLLVCTSEFEGFPNTFLQAWSAGIPVISTVNPSELITKHNLGEVVETEEQFQAVIKKLLVEKNIYAEKCKCVEEYFEKNHSDETNFHRLLKYIRMIS